MKYFGLALIFCCITTFTFAQKERLQHQADSLKGILEKHPTPQSIEEYMRLATRVIYVEPERVDELIGVIERSAAPADYKFAPARINVLKLVILINESQFDSAELLLTQVRKTAEKTGDKLGLIHYYLNEGIIQKRKGNYELSTTMYYKGLVLADELNDNRFKLALYNNLGALYNANGDYQSAKKVILKSISIFRQTKEESATSIGNIYSNLAVTYKNMKQLDSALFYYEKARKEFEAANNVLVSGVYCNIGILYGDLKKYDQAEMYLQKALTLTRSFRQINYEVNVLNSLAEIRVSTKQYNEAIEYARQSLDLAKKKGLLLAQYQALKYLHASYAKLGKYEMAYNMFTEAAALNDSLYSIEKEEVAREIREKYETDKKDEEIRFANMQIEEEKRHSYYLWATVLTFGVFIIFIWFMYVRTGKLNKKIAAQARAIEIQNTDLEKVNQVKNRLFAVVSHDLRAPVSSLHSLLLLLNSPGVSNEKKEMMHKQLQVQLEQTTTLMETLLQWAKTQMKGWEVKLESIDTSLLASDLEGQFTAIAAHKNISFDLQGMHHIRVKGDKQLLYVVLYNLVSNAIKFTPDGGKVWAETTRLNNKVQLFICDNGKGIHQNELASLLDEYHFETTKGTAGEKGFGMGLKICLELARQMNGSISIQSAYGEGSRFCLELPA